MEPIDHGAIIYSSGDTVLQHDLGLRRRITLVLPRVGVFNTTVFNNVAYGLSIRGIDKEIRTRSVEKVLETVGLRQKQELNALALSSGETQRLGIARAMVLEPDMLFLDEPTTSTDEYNTAVIEEIILAQKLRGKTSIILSTHDRDQAERIAEWIVLMKNGYIINIS